MKKRTIIFIILAIFVFFILFIFKVKNNKIGNNNINQDSVKDIFNMQEYEAEIEVTVISNKNENKYKIRKQYTNKEDKSIQEVLEPENLKGVKIIKQGNKITLENTQLNLNKIFEECNNISENDMDLETFIKDFKENPKEGKSEENSEQIILKYIVM